MKASASSKILISLFCLTLFSVFSSLGVWQLSRAQDKEKQANQILSNIQSSPTNLNHSLADMSPFKHALAKGRYLPEDQFLLDNIVHKGKPGYYVLTPFKLSDSDDVILVNRGWLPKTSPLPALPDITLASTNEMQTIEGILAEVRSKPVIVGSTNSPESPTPPLWFYMDKDYFEAQKGYQVLPLVLRLKPENGSQFVRDWPSYRPKTGMHIGYAIQWFVFAGFVLLGWVGMLYKQNSNANNKRIKTDNRINE